ncbi:MAG: murein biosynthesis integral membrane protein MurJ [Magnetococcales bacterium]|nr:murein biosynthesis integral membrane protein MurJ [Magnetococcales bacterium]
MNSAATAKKDQNRLVRAVGTIGFYTLLSRVLGFVRDIILARAFGAGMGADAFFVALKLPNFLRRLFAEGAFNTAFVPVFNDVMANHTPEEVRHLAQSVFTILAVVVAAVVVVVELFMPGFIMLVAPGFTDEPEKYQLTVDLTRITFPYILFISLVALTGGILNSYRKFAIPAATPILLNVFIILGAVGLAPTMERPAMGLAVGVLIGGIAQLAIQWPPLLRINMPLKFRWDPRNPAIKQILSLMGPSLLGVSVMQISLLFDIFLASWLPEGSISFLYYADRMVEFPLGIIGIAMATAILPGLSARAARQDIDGMKRELDFALRMTLLINLPAAVGLIVLREPILSLLFERGAFDAQTTEMTSRALLAYGSGLLAFSAVKIITPAFYALKDTKTPVRIAITCLIFNMVMNVILMFPLKHVGLALATSLASYLNTVLLLVYLKRKTGFSLSRAFYGCFGKGIVASAVMVVFLSWGVDQYWQAGLSLTEKGIVLIPLIFGSMALYFGVAILLRMQEVGDLFSVLLKRKRSVSESLSE